MFRIGGNNVCQSHFLIRTFCMFSRESSRAIFDLKLVMRCWYLLLDFMMSLSLMIVLIHSNVLVS